MILLLQLILVQEGRGDFNMMKTYKCHKIVQAEPMTRGDYNIFKGWTIPPDENPDDEGYLVKYSDDYKSWSSKAAFEEGYIELEKTIIESPQGKILDISEQKGAKANISDLVVYGDTDTFRLLCKASSKSGGWMKCTKVCNVHGGCIVQVTTQQGDNVAEALTYVPGMHIDIEANPRRLVIAVY